MEDKFVVALIVEFLSMVKEKRGSAFSLVQLINYVDYTNKCVPTRGEVRRAMKIVDGIQVRRQNGLVFFRAATVVRKRTSTITAADLQFAYQTYRQNF